ncbi:3-oxoacyl-[acyl-carrier protein] reductase [Phyllobacterium sp. CL33Tsu]|uniref:SDR family oxidoreductase n=1 Tax=Phyllobacterium TaxID=28100 RepID=UPI0008E7ED06|nr:MULTISPECIES: SDR family oxidoreductase [unclassified Phyllobacterium]UGY10205.1 SDR family oxidoreductase [Phyllobacterium sp. T1018]SFI71791.1 3-oxoacyl-[acyl-carrier protein] reductase [Phyllobacterium sp. CL33Tsu]
MDLGIKGRRAIVCASSKGLGRGVAEKLAEAGVDLTLNARTESTLKATADAIAGKYGVKVQIVAEDVTTESGRQALLQAEPQPDILINNAGGPPPGVWSDWGEEEWLKAINNNMLTPILLMKAILPGMIERKWGRVVNITSGSVKSPIAQLGLSNAARSGLTGFVAGTSRQVARHGVIINNLLPGSHDTDRTKGFIERSAKEKGISIEEARKEAYADNPAGRYGTAEEFGAAAAFLCSQYSGFIVGQNLLLDGGAFNSTLG